MGSRAPIMVLTGFVGAVLSMAHSSGTSGQAIQEDLTAFAVNLIPGGPRGSSLEHSPTTTPVDIRIERWSTDQERDELLNILKNESDVHRVNELLLSALQRMPRTGFIRAPTTRDWDLRFARQHPLEEGGRRIVIATDRPIGFWEARKRPPRSDFRFSLFELRLNEQNEGEGKMLAEAKIFLHPKMNELVLQNYNILPVSLDRIRPRASSTP